MPRKQQKLKDAKQHKDAGAADVSQLSYTDLWEARFLAADTVHYFEEQDLKRPIALGLSLHSLRQQQGGAFVEHTQLDSDTDLSEITDEECEGLQQSSHQQQPAAAIHAVHAASAPSIVAAVCSNLHVHASNDVQAHEDEFLLPPSACDPHSWQRAAWHGTRACMGLQLTSSKQAEPAASQAAAASAAPGVTTTHPLHSAQYSNTDKAWMRAHVDKPRRWTAMSVLQLQQLGFRYQETDTRAYVRQGVSYVYKVVRCTQHSSSNTGVPACPVKLHLLQLPDDAGMLLVRQDGVHTHPPHKDMNEVEWHATVKQLQGGMPLSLLQALLGATALPAQPAQQDTPCPCPTAAPYSLAPMQLGTLLGALQPLGLLNSAGRLNHWQHSMHSAPCMPKDEQLRRVVGALIAQLGHDQADIKQVMGALQQTQARRGTYNLPSYERVAAAMLQNFEKQQQHTLASSMLTTPPGPVGLHSSFAARGKRVKALPAAQLARSVGRWLETLAHTQQRHRKSDTAGAGLAHSEQAGTAAAAAAAAAGGQPDRPNRDVSIDQTIEVRDRGCSGRLHGAGQRSEATRMMDADVGVGDQEGADCCAAGPSQPPFAKRRKQVHWAPDVADARHVVDLRSQRSATPAHMQPIAEGARPGSMAQQRLSVSEPAQRVGGSDGFQPDGPQGTTHCIPRANGTTVECVHNPLARPELGMLTRKTCANAAEAATDTVLWMAELLARSPVFKDPTQTAKHQEQGHTMSQGGTEQDGVQAQADGQEGYPIVVKPVKKYGRKFLTKIWSQDKELRDALAAARHPLAPEMRGGPRDSKQQQQQQQGSDSDDSREHTEPIPSIGGMRADMHAQPAAENTGATGHGMAAGNGGNAKQRNASEAWRLSPAFLVDAGLLGGDLHMPWEVSTELTAAALRPSEDDPALPGQLHWQGAAGDLDANTVPVGAWTQPVKPQQPYRGSALERHLTRTSPIMTKALSSVAAQDAGDSQQGLSRPKAFKRPLPAWTSSVLGASHSARLQTPAVTQAYWSMQQSQPQLGNGGTGHGLAHAGVTQGGLPSSSSVPGTLTGRAGGHKRRGRAAVSGSNMHHSLLFPADTAVPGSADHEASKRGVGQSALSGSGEEQGSGQARLVWTRIRRTRSGQQGEAPAVTVAGPNSSSSSRASSQPATALASGSREPAATTSGTSYEPAMAHGGGLACEAAKGVGNGQRQAGAMAKPAGLQLIQVLATRLGVKPEVAARAADRYMAIMFAAQQAGNTHAVQQLASMGGAGTQRRQQRARLMLATRREAPAARLEKGHGHAPARVQRTRRAAAAAAARTLISARMKQPGAVAWMQLLERFADLQSTGQYPVRRVAEGNTSSSDTD